MLAGSQGGKTSFGPLWLWREIQQRGPGDYLAVTATFPLMKLKMLPEFRRLFEYTLRLGEWSGSDKVFTFHDGGSRVIFGTATHPESLESATAKAAWLDEAGQDQFRLESWEAINRRLTLHQGRALLTTTPYNLGWLKQQLYDRWAAGDPDYDVIQFESIANPTFPREEYERLRRTLPAWKFDMFHRGLLARPAGLIYADFVDDYREQGGHKVHAFDLPPEWPRYGGLDFGGVNTARLMIAHDPRANVYYVYDESLGGGMTTAEHAREAKALTDGVNLIAWYGGSGSEDQLRRDWTDNGVYVQEPPLSERGGTALGGIVEAGIDRVIGLFKERRLYVFDTCRGLLDELGTYKRKLDDQQQPTREIDNKAAFHRCFVPGTLVSTARGKLPIESVRPGEWVMTRHGYRQVTAAGLSAASVSTVRIRLSNGEVLAGTPNHPIWARGHGWIPLGALRYGMLLVCEQRPSPGRAFGSTVTRRARVVRTASTIVPRRNTQNAASDICTLRSGSPSTDRFLTATTSITATEIRSTTPPTTLRRSRRQRTTAIIMPGLGPSRSERTSNASDQRPRPGIAVKRAASGISSTAVMFGPCASQWSGNASTAARRSTASRDGRMTDSVAMRASRLGDERAESMTSSARVSFARHRSALIAMPALGRVRLRAVRVLAIENGPVSPVYNLTVEGASEFFANGVLAHNCDALRYVAQGITDAGLPFGWAD